MADAFTISNRLKRKVTAVDREREIITTREKARQDAIDTARRREREDLQTGITINQENRAQANFEDTQVKSDLAIEALTMELKKQREQISQGQSDNAFKMFLSDGNTGHLEKLFRDNEFLRKTEAAGGPEIISFDKVDPVNDARLINQSGLDPDEFVEEEAIKRYVRTTDSAGNKEILDLDKLLVGTGFFDRQEEGELDRMIKRRQARGSAGNTSQRMNDARFLIEQGEAATIQEAFQKLDKINPQKSTKTSAEKKLEASNANTQAMFDEFGGEEEFFKTDFSEPENRRRIADEIALRKKDLKVGLSATERKKFREASKLLSLGKTAGETLTPSETGVIDNILSDAKKFITDDVKGVEGRAAYASYRNVVRHVLFGAVLPPGEMKQFNQAFGSLGQQLGPVLQQLAVSMGQVKSDLESLAATTDPIIAHVELGASMEEIDQVITNIDKHIADLDEMAKTGTITLATPPERFRTPGINPDADRKISDFNFTTGE